MNWQRFFLFKKYKMKGKWTIFYNHAAGAKMRSSVLGGFTRSDRRVARTAFDQYSAWLHTWVAPHISQWNTNVCTLIFKKNYVYSYTKMATSNRCNFHYEYVFSTLITSRVIKLFLIIYPLFKKW